MRNREYWQKRFSAVEEMRNKRGRLTVDQIAPHFDRAQAAIDKEIRVWYQRFADNNGISLAEAKKLLQQNELDELKWDIEEYIKRGQENAVSQKWLKELENASAKFHISRLEALKLRTQNAAENAFAAEQNRLTDRLSDTWKEDYYHTAFEVQKGFSLGFDVAQVDEKRVNKLLDTPWTADGQTFSDRIWKSKAQLLDSVSSELTQMCILGKAPDDAIAAIAKRMNVAKSQAGRLVMTENAYFGSAAQQQCYKALDVERYQIVATLDSRTSDICRHFDGKVFDMKDYEPGVTAPPFHVYCRSCTVPYFADNDENGMRAARDENGKTYYVSADMTYEEWAQRSVKGERGITNKRAPKENDYRVNFDVVNAPGYMKKFRGMTGNTVADESLCKYARAALTHRDGTANEDLYIISRKTGKVLGKNIADETEFGVGVNDDIRKAVQNNQGDLIGIHTHPDGTPPTGSDFETSARRGYELGVAACADGSVYVYKHSDRPVTQRFIDETIEKYKKRVDSDGKRVYHSDIEAHLAALDQLAKEYGLYYEKR